MTDGCRDCGAPVEPVHGMPGYVVCTDESCPNYNAAYEEDQADG